MPRRADIDPLEIPRRNLPDLMLIDVLHDPERYRYRLVGTRVVAPAPRIARESSSIRCCSSRTTPSRSSSIGASSRPASRSIRWSRSGTTSSARPIRSIACCSRSRRTTGRSTC
ncbi:MAG: hypothetical protein ACREE7_04055 [Dongiaceae bacterium]